MALSTRATPLQLLKLAQRRLFAFFLTSMSWVGQHGGPDAQDDEGQHSAQNEVRFVQVLAKPLRLFRFLGLATFTPDKTRKAIIHGTSSSKLWNKLVIVFNTHIAIISTYCLVRTSFVGGDLLTFFVMSLAWSGYVYVALLLTLVLRQTNEFVQVLNRLIDLEENLKSQLGCLSPLGRQPAVIYLTFGLMFICVTWVGHLVSTITIPFTAGKRGCCNLCGSVLMSAHRPCKTLPFFGTWTTWSMVKSTQSTNADSQMKNGVRLWGPRLPRSMN
jgi:hypothetical protein